MPDEYAADRSSPESPIGTPLGCPTCGRNPLAVLDDHQVCDEQLREAIALVEEWAGYASDYFQEKWDLAGDLARLRSYLYPASVAGAPSTVDESGRPDVGGEGT